MYAVKNEVFEGPLDLLLYLVDKNRLDITEISLASICDEYSHYLTRLRQMNLEVESSFLTTFASLLEIKSKHLLPPAPKDEVGAETEPPEHELVTKLREYRKFKEAVLLLDRQKEITSLAFPREHDSNSDEAIAILTSQVTAFDLMDVYLEVMRNFECRKKEETIIELSKEIISMQFMLKLISKKIKEKKICKLYELFDCAPDRLYFIVTFLALLELARRRKINLLQDSGCGVITIISCRQANVEVSSEDRGQKAG